jgi:hypothetical protein
VLAVPSFAAEFAAGGTIVLLARSPQIGTLFLVDIMLIAAFIFVISIAAAIQFAAMGWRGELARVALLAKTPTTVNSLITNEFSEVSAYQALCPDLTADSAPKLRSVKLYYHLLQAARSISEGWANREMALCARYASVVLAQRMERNQALLAEVRSY